MYNNIYNITNDFIKESQKNSDFAKIMSDWNGKRGPKRKLTLSKVIALNIYRFSFHIKDLKAFHRFVKETNLEPNMPNYENFLKASNKALPILSIFLRFLLKQNQEKNGIILNSTTRKNMNRTISKDQLNHLRKRNRIETI